MTTWAVRHPPFVLLICLNSFGPKKDWIFCARFSPEPGLPHWAQANNPRNWGSQRCPKIHWRHRSAFKSHKCKRPKLSCCVEVIECPILYVDQMWGLTNSLQDSVCWVCEPDGGGWWFISRDEHGRLEARWLLAIPTWSTQVGFTIESCTLFLSPIRLENLSPLFISATQATQSCEGDASKLAASFARTVSSVRRSEKTTWRPGRRRAKDWL